MKEYHLVYNSEEEKYKVLVYKIIYDSCLQIWGHEDKKLLESISLNVQTYEQALKQYSSICSKKEILLDVRRL